MNILIIDDDQEDTSLFCEALSELDQNAICTVAHTCENIQAFVRILKEVDIIFIDAHMYPIDGKTCLSQLIHFIDRSRTKIVIHSTCLSPEEQVALQLIGVDYFLTKASSYPLLRSNISEMMTNHLSTIL